MSKKLLPKHCSVCNRIFTLAKKKTDLCPFCGSPYIHDADATCKAMTFNEWKNDEKTASLVQTIPDATGNSDDDNIVW